MARLEYFLVAESLSVDSGSGAISIFNVLNEILSDEFPFDIPRLTVISCWVNEKEEIESAKELQLKLEFQIPGLDEVPHFRGNLTCESKHQHFNFGFRDIPIEEAGEFVITIFLDDVEQASHTVSIISS